MLRGILESERYGIFAKYKDITHVDQLFCDRFNIVQKDPALAHHVNLLETMGVQGMSSDESCYEDTHVVYNRVTPAWRSQELQNFLWHLDDILVEVAKRPLGNRCHATQKNRRRPRTNLKLNEASIAPTNLPQNCYRPGWLKSLRQFQLKQLNMDNDNYDFSIDM